MEKLIGVGFVLLSSTAFGVMPLFAHLTANSGADLVTTLFGRFTVAALALWLIVYLRKLPLPLPQNRLPLLAIGGVLFVGQSLCYFGALTLIPAGLVAMLLYLYPTIVAIVTVALGDEPLTRPKLIALSLATLGVALAVGPERAGSPLGLLLGFGTAIIYASYVIIISRILRSEPSALVCLTWVMSGAALVYGILGTLQGWTPPQNNLGWLGLVALGLICTALAAVTLFAGVQKIGATTASTLSTWEPIVTVATASLFLGEQLPPLGILGGGFIMVAVLLLAFQPPESHPE